MSGVASDVVSRLRKAGVASTMCAAEEFASALNAMSYHFATAVLADRRQLVNRTFEAVEHMPVSRGDHLKTEGVLVSANFTLCHVGEMLPGSIQFVRNRDASQATTIRR